MKKTILTVATLGIAFGTAAFAGSPSVKSASVTEVRATVMQDQAKDPATLKTFTGMISKDGEQFILKDETNKISYQLDDQQTAQKFAGKKVRVTGTLDASNNTIRVQTIEEATA
jgi:uncharacterized protein YdeI (BOF family)